MNNTLQENPDGSWTKAKTIPYKPDTRTFWQRVRAVAGLPFVYLRWRATRRKVFKTPGNQYVTFDAYRDGAR